MNGFLDSEPLVEGRGSRFGAILRRCWQTHYSHQVESRVLIINLRAAFFLWFVGNKGRPDQVGRRRIPMLALTRDSIYLECHPQVETIEPLRRYSRLNP
jgi:hypothetical protein